ncbi:MAG TPA: four-carbon acid sugar kinase family protein [Chryseolinea sp.]|nr:four-carbon acid sugar kinase family protein [Chryseolinea sp.]
MVIVLADDFSGAAEIGGIGHRYGLGTEVQLSMDLNTTADLVVVDTNTRSLSEGEAAEKIFDTGTALKKLNKPFYLFKKIDSVMRGHLIPELDALQDCFNFNRILLMPANPGRGRKIIGGEYLINGVKLHETIFAGDPDFPVLSSNIGQRIGSYIATLKHVHITPGDFPSSGSIVTGDIESKVDFKNYVASLRQDDLCCGAAELFEAFLEHLGFSSRPESALGIESSKSEFTLIINGTTVKNQNERDLYNQLNIPQLPLPGNFNDTEFDLQQDVAIAWFQKVLDVLQTRKVAVVTIDHPVQQNKILSEKFLKYFVELMTYITQNITLNKIHFCLTGGATASALIRHYTNEKLFVKGEIVSGVVSLALNGDGMQQGRFTVKPGSYPWPPRLIESLSS